MNQGMVASVIGKFTNTSAHTSYLYLVKEPIQRLRFATVPTQANPRGSTLSVRRAGGFVFRISTRCRSGPPLYIDSFITVNVPPGRFRIICSGWRSCRLKGQPEEARIIGAEFGASSTKWFFAGRAAFWRPLQAGQPRSHGENCSVLGPRNA